MVDLTGSYNSTWRLMSVDPDTWESVDGISGVTDITITKSDKGNGESASLKLDQNVRESPYCGWARVEAVIRSGTTTDIAPISTLYLMAEDGKFENLGAGRNVSGFSVLWPASKRKLRSGAYAPKGADGAAWVADLLSTCISAPIRIEGSFLLSDHIVFKGGTTYLDAATTVLDAAGWRLRVNGHGDVTICERQTEPSFEVTPSNVCDGISFTSADAETTNTYYVSDGREEAVAVNDDPASVTSTVSTGIIIEEVDLSPKRVNGESLQGYADRKLLEARLKSTKAYTWTRDYAQDIVPSDLIRAEIEVYGICEELRVKSQVIRCSDGLTLQETTVSEGWL